MDVREVWLQAHLKQPLGSRDGYRTRQRGGSGLKSSTGGSRSGSSAMARAGGVLPGYIAVFFDVRHFLAARLHQ